MKRALEDRLAEVRGRQAALARTPPVAGAGRTGAAGPADDAEETLHVVMVRLWPRARSAGGSDVWPALFEALHRLEAAARDRVARAPLAAQALLP